MFGFERSEGYRGFKGPAVFCCEYRSGNLDGFRIGSDHHQFSIVLADVSRIDVYLENSRLVGGGRKVSRKIKVEFHGIFVPEIFSVLSGDNLRVYRVHVHIEVCVIGSNSEIEHAVLF